MGVLDFTTREGRKGQGKLIQQAAEEAGLSLEALARRIGCSRALIYQYVSGATLAQPDRIQQIAEITGKSLLFFYGGEATPDNLDERLQALQQLLAAQVSPPDLKGALSSCEQMIALARQAGDARVEAGARLRLAAILLQQGEPARALAALDLVIPFLRQHGLEARLPAAEQNRGHALLALGRVEEAEACFLRVVAGGEWTARWQGYISLAAVAEQQGHYDRALERLDQALALETSAPDPRAAQVLRLYAAGNLANIHLACGDAATAAAEAAQAGELAVQSANRDQYIESLLTLGVCQRAAGALGASRATLAAAARWARLAEDKGREALAWAESAATLVEAGRYDDARVLAKDALQQGIATGARRAELAAHLALTGSYGRADLPQEARYHAAQAWEISTLLAHPYAQAQALIALGDAALARGDAAEAHIAYDPAFDLAESLGARLPALQAALGLAAAAPEASRLDADELLARAREVDCPLLAWPALLRAGMQAGDDLDAAEGCFTEAIAVLGALRAGLAGEPDGDTYLEYRLAWEPYLRLADLYRLRGDDARAVETLAGAEWPPLDALEADAV
jgi:tetratricopeptide (TPR) repeat protein